MSRTFRMVPEEDWLLGDAIAMRHSRLLNVPAPDDLLAGVLREAQEAVLGGYACLNWKPAAEATGFFRVEAVIPLSDETFDQFFNGRSGYRAQFYLSPEEGVLFNRDVVQGLKCVLSAAHIEQMLAIAPELISLSFDGPHSKVWVYSEDSPFDSAAENSINPPRWIENNARLGRRAPLPKSPALELKGVFIHPRTRELFVDPLKVDRACDLRELKQLGVRLEKSKGPGSNWFAPRRGSGLTNHIPPLRPTPASPRKRR